MLISCQPVLNKLVFNDSELKKLAPCTLEIGTYTTDTVKNVGSCLFHLVHPDTTKLQEVTFYVAQNNGSVLLTCTTTLVVFTAQEMKCLLKAQIK